MEYHILHTFPPWSNNLPEKIDDTLPNFGPNAPFWETPIREAIASFGTRVSSPKSEEEHRKYHAAILRAWEVEK